MSSCHEMGTVGLSILISGVMQHMNRHNTNQFKYRYMKLVFALDVCDYWKLVAELIYAGVHVSCYSMALLCKRRSNSH